jgi:hypothetical protein
MQTTSDCKIRLVTVLQAAATDGDEKTRRAVHAGLEETSANGTTLATRKLAAEFSFAVSASQNAGHVLEQQALSEPWKAETPADRLPPTREDLVVRPTVRTWYRLLAYVEQFLSADPGERVKEAFAAVAAPDCDTVLTGRVRETCNELGLVTIQRASFTFAIGGLRESRGNLKVVGRCLAVDRNALDKALLNVEVTGDPGSWSYAQMLRHWLAKPPTRWEAWADLDAAF